MALREVALNDKYDRAIEESIYINGTQALFRLSLNQVWRDRQHGLNTAAYVSGYRGSPMHNVDKEYWRASKHLNKNDVFFHPAVNEDMAATALWGTQQVPAMGDAKYDGVASIWFGKGPGLDRSVDAIRHANLHGTSKYGGVLVAVGDDAPMMSTDVPAASETLFSDMFMPVLYPTTIQEVLDFGIIGWGMSRFSGLWTGFKLTADTVDAVTCVDPNPNRVKLITPEFDFPPGGVNYRFMEAGWAPLEARLRHYKVPAALAYARANNVNQRVIDSPKRRFGIVTAGNAAIAVRQAFVEMGITDAQAADLGISVLRIGMPYPLDKDLLRDFATGLEEVFVIEEKRRIIEGGMRDALYDVPQAQRPKVYGRYDENNDLLIPNIGAFGPEAVIMALSKRIAHIHSSDQIKARVEFLETKKTNAQAREVMKVKRTPFFCSGCPHNSSTKVPEGSTALAGVGCHFMAHNMDRNNIAHTHMGAEGGTWIGIQPFTTKKHIFTNMGDGTFYHSGLMAIRAAVSGKVNITYKVLFNDAVAMTGGQPHDGEITPETIARMCHSEGVKKIVVVTDEPEKLPSKADWPSGTTIEHRRHLDHVQRDLEKIEGVSVLLYVQTCAAEKRRRRKKKIIEDPVRRVFVNHRVCEGCGDCSKESNCISILPHETEFGRKRLIDQSSCNKDYSCANGFCPSFVQVVGATPKKLAGASEVPEAVRLVPEPTRATLPDGDSYNILLTGIGGTGVVTVTAVLTMGAHLEGKVFSTVDEFGMAQKGGAVKGHVRIANRLEDMGPSQLSTGSADVILGCDNLVTAGEDVLKTISPTRTSLVVNTNEAITGQFVLNPDLKFPTEQVDRRIRAEADEAKMDLIDAKRLATSLMGDSIMSNLFILGFAYQRGLIPLTVEALMKAIEINGTAVKANQQAFEWGRRYAFNPQAIEALVATPAEKHPESDDEIIAHRRGELVAYQSEAYAKRYEDLVRQVQQAETQRASGFSGLTGAVARNLYKLMAYKDEYEVARLYSYPGFRERLEAQFDNIGRIEALLAPPLLTRIDKKTGKPRKKTFGPWIFPAMRQLAKLKRLRGTALDVFGYFHERKQERALITEYAEIIEELLNGLSSDTHAQAVAIAEIPAKIRGYGHVKAPAMDVARAEWTQAMREWRTGPKVAAAAE